MTKHLSSKTVRKSLLAILIALLCLSLTLAVACGTLKEPSDESFTKSETDELVITNGTFEYGTADVESGDFPYSASGWSVSTDNSAATSYVSSGIIDVENWDSLVTTLYNDNDFKNYILKKYFDGNSATEESTVKEKIKEVYKTSSEPEADSKDHKVYMLNNYQQYTSSVNFYGLGTAQKVTSSTTINLEDGQYGKFTVYVKTVNLASVNASYGANIRLTNTISGVSQNEYRISNINTNGEWKKYVIYVQAADFSDTSLNVVLGLGYGNGHSARTDGYCEGTVYFDDISFEQFDDYAELLADVNANNIKIDSADVNMTGANVLSASAVNYATYTSINSTKGTEITPDDLTASLGYYCSYYDMTLEYYLDKTGKTYFNDLIEGTDYTVSKDQVTVSNADEGGTVRGDRFTPVGGLNTRTYNAADKTIIFNVSKASYNYEIKSSLFNVNYGEYVQISFYLNTNLGANDRTGLSVYAYDVEGTTYNPSGSDHLSLLLDSVKTDSDETVLYSLIFRNNFPGSAAKTFYLGFYVGPTNVASQNDPTYYPTGTVTLSDLRISTASVNKKVLGVANENYDIYYLFSSISDDKIATCNLYSGYSEDYTAPTDTQSYAFSPSSEDLGNIASDLANPYGHTGVNSASRYIAATNTDYTINDTSVNGVGVTYAGVFNTKYIDDNKSTAGNGYYELDQYAITKGYTGIANALDWTDGDVNVQPLVILNKSAANYGYFTGTSTIEASSYAVYTVKVKAVGDAIAYVYVVDMTDDSESKLSVMTFTTGEDGAAVHQLVAKITEADCIEDGWLTVSFYIATGSSSKSYRIELWNGARDGSDNSTGMVFFDDYSTSESFEEGDIYKSDSPLYIAYTQGKISFTDVERYTRKLTQAEIDFNASAERINKGYAEVSYSSAPVYATDGKSIVYAVYNTVDPVEVDPWAKYEEEEKEDEDGESCINWSSETFWLNLASIILAVVLVAAIIIVVLRSVKRRKLNSAKDVRQHYSVKSRNAVHERNKQKAEKAISETADTADTSVPEDIQSEKVEPEQADAEETAETENDDTEITLTEEQQEEFVYGDVLEDFGDDIQPETTDVSSKPNTEDNGEQTETDDKKDE